MSGSCQGCGRDISHRSAQARYCDEAEKPDCKREREAHRKAKQRAIAHNTLIAEAERDAPIKRDTGRHSDSDSDHNGAIDEFALGGGMSWDDIRKAWSPCRSTYEGGRWRVLPASRGPEINPKIKAHDSSAQVQQSDVDRLMAEAERASGRRRAAKRGVWAESGPPGPVRSNWHVASARRLPPDFKDRHCAGELWLRGEAERAVAKAAKAQARERQRLSPRSAG
jgi:hypothetical protein